MKSLSPIMRNFAILSALLLTACATAGAEPERYAEFDCQQLSELSRSYTQTAAIYDPFKESDRIKNERRSASDRKLGTVGQSRAGLRPYEVEQEKDLNSIRAASRLKGC